MNPSRPLEPRKSRRARSPDSDLRRAGINERPTAPEIPKTVVLDYSKESLSRAAGEAAAMLGVTLVYAPGGTPECKPHVERLLDAIDSACRHGFRPDGLQAEASGTAGISAELARAGTPQKTGEARTPEPCAVPRRPSPRTTPRPDASQDDSIRGGASR